jgi:hypothetical protein
MEVRGTLAPTGTLLIQGNLRLIADEGDPTTICYVTPQAQDKVRVSGTPGGTARLAGRLIVFLSGAYTPDANCLKRFTLLQADGGRSLTFGSVSINYPVLQANYTPSITYDANNVYLDLVYVGCFGEE